MYYSICYYEKTVVYIFINYVQIAHYESYFKPRGTEIQKLQSYLWLPLPFEVVSVKKSLCSYVSMTREYAMFQVVWVEKKTVYQVTRWFSSSRARDTVGLRTVLKTYGQEICSCDVYIRERDVQQVAASEKRGILWPLKKKKEKRHSILTAAEELS